MLNGAFSVNWFSFSVIDLHLTGNPTFSRKLFVNYQISHFSKGNLKKLDFTLCDRICAGFTLFIYEASNSLVDDKNIQCDYNKFEFSVYTVRIFMKCTHVCAVQIAY